MEAYVYIRSEPGLWTVGFYGQSGKWIAESDHNDREEAAKRVAILNGGIPYTEFAKTIKPEIDYKALYLEGRELIEGAIRIRDCWGVGPKPIPTMNQGEHEAIMKMEGAFKAFLAKTNDLTNHKDGE